MFTVRGMAETIFCEISIRKYSTHQNYGKKKIGFRSDMLAIQAFAFLLHQVARSGPEMLCHTLKTALGKAAMGAKCAVARAAPNPAFCMPTSIETAFLSG